MSEDRYRGFTETHRKRLLKADTKPAAQQVAEVWDIVKAVGAAMKMHGVLSIPQRMAIEEFLRYEGDWNGIHDGFWMGDSQIIFELRENIKEAQREECQNEAARAMRLQSAALAWVNG